MLRLCWLDLVRDSLSFVGVKDAIDNDEESEAVEKEEARKLEAIRLKSFKPEQPLR